MIINRNSLFIVSILSFSLLLQSCGKDEEVKGCKDPDSVNYNVNAEIDDASCRYAADAYEGNFITTDTITYMDPNTGDQVTSTQSYSFSITKTGKNTVQVSNFAGCNSATATVTQTNLTFTNPSLQCGFDLFISQFRKERLSYHYQRYAGVTQSISGTAIKQP